MSIKEKVNILKSSRNPFLRFTFLLLKLCWHTTKLLISRPYRSFYLTKWKFGANYYQRSFFTLTNRYPELFRQCQLYFENAVTPKILSFGCSTGEEVFTIGEYLPNALVFGVDINTWCIKQCKKKYKNPRFIFNHSLAKEFDKSGDFDAIFCLAVFQRTENRIDISEKAQGLTFEQFENQIAILDEKLKPDGLFIIDHADFSFFDTNCAKNYKPLNFESNAMRRNRPLFDKQNNKIAETQMQFRIFVKQKPDKL